MPQKDENSLKDQDKGKRSMPSSDFEAVLNRIKAALEAKSDSELSNKFGIRRQTISQARKKGEVPPKWYFQVSEMTGCSIDWLRTGETEPPPALKQTTNYQVTDAQSTYGAEIEAEHLEIARQFKDRPLAQEIYRDLLELEALNPEALRTIGAHIKGLVEGIKLAGGPERSNRPKPTPHQPNARKQTPDKADRQDGKERKNKTT